VLSNCRLADQKLELPSLETALPEMEEGEMINGFKLHENSTAPVGSGEILDSVQKAWGFVPNLHRVLAESPAALEAYGALWGIAEKTSFTPARAQYRLSGHHL
jgi:hypothetical protein